MKHLFRVNPTAVAGKEKVGDTNFQEHYAGVNMNMMWKELTPGIRQATNIYLLPWIGEELYSRLCDLIPDEDTISPNQARILELLRDATASFAVAITLPVKKTVLASMGAIENNAPDNTTKDSLWGFKATLSSAFENGGKFLDEALLLLEKYKDDTYFDVWRESEAYAAGSTDLFRNAREFEEYTPIAASRRTFISMRSVINEVARVKLKAILCSAQYDDLKGKITSTNLSDPNKKLLDLSRRVVAKWAVSEAVVAIPVLPERDGFRIITNTDAIDTRNQAVETIKDAIIGIKTQAEKAAETATADLLGLLYDNPDNYPLWRDSGCRKASTGEFSPITGECYGAIML